MSWWRSEILVVALALALSGCGQLPRPFQPGSRADDNPLLRLSDSQGVVVAPVYDAPPVVSAPLAERMAEEIRTYDIPATASGVLPRGYLLEGWYRLERPRDERAELVIDWRLTDRRGNEVATDETRRPISLRRWPKDAGGMLAAIAEGAAPGFARAMIGERPRDAAPEGPTLAIAGIEGAPGDGGEALRRAFRITLERASIAIAETPETAAARLSGRIEVTPASETADLIRLVWTIRDSEDREVAVLRQENNVPKGRLDDRWGRMAFDVALAMREGIVEAMRRLDGTSHGGLGLPPTLR